MGTWGMGTMPVSISISMVVWCLYGLDFNLDLLGVLVEK